MEHWQTELKKIADNCCLFCCYLKAIGIEPDTTQDLMALLEKSLSKGYIDQNCTVLDAEKLLNNFSGHPYKVFKKEISSISEIKGIAPVRFDYGLNGHWVLVQDGKIVFNPLEKSVCVANGKPTTARILTIV